MGGREEVTAYVNEYMLCLLELRRRSCCLWKGVLASLLKATCMEEDRVTACAREGAHFTLES